MSALLWNVGIVIASVPQLWPDDGRIFSHGGGDSLLGPIVIFLVFPATIWLACRMYDWDQKVKERQRLLRDQPWLDYLDYMRRKYEED